MNKKLIGILGGGQLARMMTQSAHKLGYKTVILDSSKDCSAFTIADEFIESSYTNLTNLELLASKVNYLTYEFENINFVTLDTLQKKIGNKLVQTAHPIYVSQNRLREKTFAKNAMIRIADFAALNNEDDLMNFLKKHKKVVVKTQELGYDGKGQVLINDKNDTKKIYEAKKLLLQTPCIVEEFINFKFEVSIIGAYLQSEEIVTFPLSYNVHSKGVLFSSEILSPSEKFNLNKNDINSINEEAKKIFTKFIKLLGNKTILTIEFFVDQENNLVFNEIAPRVHNSGHHTMVNFNYSQFDLINHLLINKPLPALIKNKDEFVMINVLGQHMAALKEWIKKNASTLSSNDFIFYDYEKNKMVNMRKVGHVFINKKAANKNLYNELVSLLAF